MHRIIAVICACFLLLVVSQVSFAGQAEVRDIQQQLTEMGYDPGPVDGAWGGKTEAAARKFLGDKGLDEESVFSSGGRDDDALLDHIRSVKAAEKKAKEEAALRAAKGFALVIGNAAYENTRALKNPANDAALMASALKSAGFVVTYLSDTDQKAMKKAMLTFTRHLRKLGKPGFFYYAGHAVQADGANYLVPIGAKVEDEAELAFEGVPMQDFLRTLDRDTAAINIVVIDAYRDNPYREKFTSAKRGLVSVDAPKGTYLVLASSPDQEGAGEGKDYSPYTWALVNAMLKPGLPVEEVFKNARKDYLSATQDAAPPYEVSSVTGEFAFLAPGQAVKLEDVIAQAVPRDDSTILGKSVLVHACYKVGFFTEYFPMKPRSAAFLIYFAKNGDKFLFDDKSVGWHMPAGQLKFRKNYPEHKMVSNASIRESENRFVLNAYQRSTNDDLAYSETIDISFDGGRSCTCKFTMTPRMQNMEVSNTSCQTCRVYTESVGPLAKKIWKDGSLVDGVVPDCPK